METKQTFSEIVTLEGFLAKKSIKPNAIKIAKTTNGSTILTAYGSPIATIKKELQGASLAETAANLAAINLCFGMPHAKSVDQSGRASLPCAMESKSEWDEVALF